MTASETINALYEDMKRRGVIREVPANVQREIRERFIRFYARYDSRLRHIRRERVSVGYNREGKIRVSCVYHGVAYGQVYNN